MIKKFHIKALFGFRNINIPFNKQGVKILIGENGLGKTTVLNCLYYVLSENYRKLALIEFEKIRVDFNDGEKIVFYKRELETYLRFLESRIRRPIEALKIDTRLIDDLERALIKANLGAKKKEGFIHRFISNQEIDRWAPTRVMTHDIMTILNEPILKKFFGFKMTIDKINAKILYFPTYRRVEEDLKNIGRFKRRMHHPSFDDDFITYDEDDIEFEDETLIHFGMEDVKKRVEYVKKHINTSTIAGFSNVTGKILSQLLKGFPDIEENSLDKLDIPTARIVLHRVGDSLSDSDRTEILHLLDSPENLLKKKELTYFLLNLIEIYNSLKHVDDAIKKFRDVCNRYLEDKEIKYNESTVSIEIYMKGTNEIVALNQLSSGEKQIVSLFSKIYLEFSEDNYIVLFDEPELSLSIEWQSQLLPDIINSEKCQFLLSVTHSPFIFKNELDGFAVGMKSYIS